MSTLPQCPVIFASSILGGRWTPKIVHLLLRHEVLRYSEIRRGCPPISDRILSKELRELEARGLIARHDHGTIPPRTDYRLTELGQTLAPVLDAMARWGTLAQSTTASAQGAEQA